MVPTGVSLVSLSSGPGKVLIWKELLLCITHMAEGFAEKLFYKMQSIELWGPGPFINVLIFIVQLY